MWAERWTTQDGWSTTNCNLARIKYKTEEWKRKSSGYNTGGRAYNGSNAWFGSMSSAGTTFFVHLSILASKSAEKKPWKGVASPTESARRSTIASKSNIKSAWQNTSAWRQKKGTTQIKMKEYV